MNRNPICSQARHEYRWRNGCPRACCEVARFPMSCVVPRTDYASARRTLWPSPRCPPPFSRRDGSQHRGILCATWSALARTGVLVSCARYRKSRSSPPTLEHCGLFPVSSREAGELSPAAIDTNRQPDAAGVTSRPVSRRDHRFPRCPWGQKKKKNVRALTANQFRPTAAPPGRRLCLAAYRSLESSRRCGRLRASARLW